ncbi:GFA family protein [Lysobacter korlensis]|uniref:GFA family protein n=1 Tax=Lysobacter korlensis TaxID=553636 RepID=A0ABV6RRQ8_9GAMM
MLDVLDCNCSICRMTGYLHLIVPASRFRLRQGDDVLVDYRFNTGVATHRFCGQCGIKSFYVPRSHPDGISVNARCLDDGASVELRITAFDDRDREAATRALTHLTQDGG